MSLIRGVLWLIVLISLIPALILVAARVGVEGSELTVTMVMDELALREQAQAIGVDPFELAGRYQEAGLTGVALYEETPESLAALGKIAAMRAGDFRTAVLASGEVPPGIPANSTVLAELEPGALEGMLAKLAVEPFSFDWAGRTWYAVPGDVYSTLPMGPDPERVDSYARAGFEIAYRPRNHQLLARVGEDFPTQARYLVHAGLEVAGHPDLHEETVTASQRYLTGIIEGTEQSGMDRIAGKVPTVRLLSFNQDYINLRLQPQELVDKYLLAANERNITLLYLRPYTQPQLGSTLDNTLELVSGLRRALEAEGYRVGPLTALDVDYDPNPFLRALAAVGVVAGLLLLASAYPGAWGWLAAGSVAALAVLAAGLDWDALALVAALVFPVLGYSLMRERLITLGGATLVSLAGAVLLVAVGSDGASMSGLSPFRGVAATLVVPPALFLFQYALRYRRPAEWLTFLWNHQVRVGDVVLVLVAAAAAALVVLRRGNFPVIGATETELAVRQWLSEQFARPRFKELLGHPMAVLGLVVHEWPAWIRASLLTGGVVAQASILNSFSHYHTPVLVSLERTLVALVLGLAIGLLLVPLARLSVNLVRRWLGVTGGRRTEARRARSRA